MYIHTTNIVITGLNSDDKWRMNKLEGKNPRTVREDPKPDSPKKDSKEDNDQTKTTKETTKVKKTKKKKEEK